MNVLISNISEYVALLEKCSDLHVFQGYQGLNCTIGLLDQRGRVSIGVGGGCGTVGNGSIIGAVAIEAVVVVVIGELGATAVAVPMFSLC